MLHTTEYLEKKVILTPMDAENPWAGAATESEHRLVGDVRARGC